jgi:hypothetical protein
MVRWRGLSESESIGGCRPFRSGVFRTGNAMQRLADKRSGSPTPRGVKASAGSQPKGYTQSAAMVEAFQACPVGYSYDKDLRPKHGTSSPTRFHGHSDWCFHCRPPGCCTSVNTTLPALRPGRVGHAILGSRHDTGHSSGIVLTNPVHDGVTLTTHAPSFHDFLQQTTVFLGWDRLAARPSPREQEKTEGDTRSTGERLPPGLEAQTPQR